MVDGKVIAFTIAEPLNSHTLVIHIEKADAQFRGVYETLVQQFSSHLPAQYDILNREQDLGQENLRQAKLRYHPCSFVEKSIIKFF